MKHWLRWMLGGCLGILVILPVALPGAGIALAQLGEDGRIQDFRKYQQIRPDSEEIGNNAYQNAIEAGDTREEAARKAGFAAGRKAVREGAHPVYGANIAGDVVRGHGGTDADAVDAAVGTYTNGGGISGAEMGHVINRFTWGSIANLGNDIRELVNQRDNATGQRRRDLQAEIDRKGEELSDKVELVIAKASGAARGAGLSPEEEGEAIARALGGNFEHLRTSLRLTGKDLGGLIRNHLSGEGRGLSALDQGVVTGQAFQTLGNRLGEAERVQISRDEAFRAVESAGGTDYDKLGVQERLFSEQESTPGSRQENRSQSRADVVNEDAGRLAAIGRIMGGLEETSGTSVQTPHVGGDENLLAKAREGSKKYEVKPREGRSPTTGAAVGGDGSNSTPSGNSSSSSPAGETQVATSGTSGFVGDWKGDGGCSLTSISITANYTLKGAGPDIQLSVSGNEATGTGAVLFGKIGHRLRLQLNFDQMQLNGSNDEGGSCSSLFKRIQF